MQIISIVPSLAPEVNGVGDYGLSLAHRLHQEYGINTRFIIGDPHWRHSSSVDGFEVNWVDRRSPEVLHKLLADCGSQSAAVLVHYVGHGYARGGIPFWLIQGLARWKLQYPSLHLLTMFHEIYTVDPVWNPRFWLSPFQKQLITDLVEMSDRCITNVSAYAKILSDFSHGKHPSIPILPVFSSVGEPQNILPLELRKRRLVIFGQSHSKISVYRDAIPALQKICQVLKIQEILDIGPSSGINNFSIGQLPVVEAGTLSALEISDILQNSIAGFLNYDPACLTKSSIFAAYCAHGIVPINYQDKHLRADLQDNKHYLTSSFFTDNSLLGDREMQEIALNAYNWYQSHKLLVQANLFASYLNHEDHFYRR